MAVGSSMGHHEQMQKMADDYYDAARQMERAYAYGDSFFPRKTQMEVMAEQQQANARIQNWARRHDLTPQERYPMPPYADDRQLWPFTLEQHDWLLMVDRLGNYVLALAAVLWLYALTPPVWWLLRSWGWSLR